MHKKAQSIVALVTAIAFTLTQGIVPSAAWAVEGGTSREIRAESRFDLALPPDLGTIQTITSGSGPTLIHIQTAHGNYEAQQKIKSILRHLKETYGIKLLLLEGAMSKLDPELMRLFPDDPNLTNRIMDDLTKKALVKGPELFLFETPDAVGYGIEEADLYWANGEAFKAVLTEQAKTENFIRDMDLQIDRLTSPYLNKDLRAFLKTLERFDAKTLPLMEWLSYLKGEAKKTLEIDLSDPAWQVDWPMLLRVFKLKDFETRLDPKAFVTEKEAFLTALRGIPAETQQEIARLLSSPLAGQQLPDPETGLLFEKMVSALPKDFSYDAYPNVKVFIGHLILQSEVKGGRLMDEMNRLTEQVSARLARTEVEKKVLALLKDHRLLKRLFALELTPEDYEQIINRRTETGDMSRHRNRDLSPVSSLKPSFVITRFQELNASGRVRDVAFSHLEEIDSLFEKALEFYRGVKARDESMLRNVEARLKETGETKAVVVTGGFHSGPFQNYFKSKNYNYCLIAPRITSLAGREAYVEAALEVPTAAELSKATKEIFSYFDGDSSVNTRFPWISRPISRSVVDMMRTVRPLKGRGIEVKPAGTDKAEVIYQRGGLTVRHLVPVRAGVRVTETKTPFWEATEEPIEVQVEGIPATAEAIESELRQAMATSAARAEARAATLLKVGVTQEMGGNDFKVTSIQGGKEATINVTTPAARLRSSEDGGTTSESTTVKVVQGGKIWSPNDRIKHPIAVVVSVSPDEVKLKPARAEVRGLLEVSREDRFKGLNPDFKPAAITFLADEEVEAVGGWLQYTDDNPSEANIVVSKPGDPSGASFTVRFEKGESFGSPKLRIKLILAIGSIGKNEYVYEANNATGLNAEMVQLLSEIKQRPFWKEWVAKALASPRSEVRSEKDVDDTIKQYFEYLDGYFDDPKSPLFKLFFGEESVEAIFARIHKEILEDLKKIELKGKDIQGVARQKTLERFAEDLEWFANWDQLEGDDIKLKPYELIQNNPQLWESFDKKWGIIERIRQKNGAEAAKRVESYLKEQGVDEVFGRILRSLLTIPAGEAGWIHEAFVEALQEAVTTFKKQHKVPRAEVREKKLEEGKLEVGREETPSNVQLRTSNLPSPAPARQSSGRSEARMDIQKAQTIAGEDIWNWIPKRLRAVLATIVTHEEVTALHPQVTAPNDNRFEVTVRNPQSQSETFMFEIVSFQSAGNPTHTRSTVTHSYGKSAGKESVDVSSVSDTDPAKLLIGVKEQLDQLSKNEIWNGWLVSAAARAEARSISLSEEAIPNLIGSLARQENTTIVTSTSSTLENEGVRIIRPILKAFSKGFDDGTSTNVGKQALLGTLVKVAGRDDVTLAFLLDALVRSKPSMATSELIPVVRDKLETYVSSKDLDVSKLSQEELAIVFRAVWLLISQRKEGLPRFNDVTLLGNVLGALDVEHASPKILEELGGLPQTASVYLVGLTINGPAEIQSVASEALATSNRRSEARMAQVLRSELRVSKKRQAVLARIKKEKRLNAERNQWVDEAFETVNRMITKNEITEEQMQKIHEAVYPILVVLQGNSSFREDLTEIETLGKGLSMHHPERGIILRGIRAWARLVNPVRFLARYYVGPYHDLRKSFKDAQLQRKEGAASATEPATPRAEVRSEKDVDDTIKQYFEYLDGYFDDPQSPLFKLFFGEESVEAIFARIHKEILEDLKRIELKGKDIQGVTRQKTLERFAEDLEWFANWDQLEGDDIKLKPYELIQNNPQLWESFDKKWGIIERIRQKNGAEAAKRVESYLKEQGVDKVFGRILRSLLTIPAGEAGWIHEAFVEALQEAVTTFKKQHKVPRAEARMDIGEARKLVRYGWMDQKNTFVVKTKESAPLSKVLNAILALEPVMPIMKPGVKKFRVYWKDGTMDEYGPNPDQISSDPTVPKDQEIIVELFPRAEARQSDEATFIDDLNRAAKELGLNVNTQEASDRLQEITNLQGRLNSAQDADQRVALLSNVDDFLRKLAQEGIFKRTSVLPAVANVPAPSQETQAIATPTVAAPETAAQGTRSEARAAAPAVATATIALPDVNKTAVTFPFTNKQTFIESFLRIEQAFLEETPLLLQPRDVIVNLRSDEARALNLSSSVTLRKVTGPGILIAKLLAEIGPKLLGKILGDNSTLAQVDHTALAEQVVLLIERIEIQELKEQTTEKQIPLPEENIFQAQVVPVSDARVEKRSEVRERPATAGVAPTAEAVRPETKALTRIPSSVRPSPVVEAVVPRPKNPFKIVDEVPVPAVVPIDRFPRFDVNRQTVDFTPIRISAEELRALILSLFHFPSREAQIGELNILGIPTAQAAGAGVPTEVTQPSVVEAQLGPVTARVSPEAFIAFFLASQPTPLTADNIEYSLLDDFWSKALLSLLANLYVLFKSAELLENEFGLKEPRVVLAANKEKFLAEAERGMLNQNSGLTAVERSEVRAMIGSILVGKIIQFVEPTPAAVKKFVEAHPGVSVITAEVAPEIYLGHPGAIPFMVKPETLHPKDRGLVLSTLPIRLTAAGRLVKGIKGLLQQFERLAIPIKEYLVPDSEIRFAKFATEFYSFSGYLLHLLQATIRGQKIVAVSA